MKRLVVSYRPEKLKLPLEITRMTKNLRLADIYKVLEIDEDFYDWQDSVLSNMKLSEDYTEDRMYDNKHVNVWVRIKTAYKIASSHNTNKAQILASQIEDVLLAQQACRDIYVSDNFISSLTDSVEAMGLDSYVKKRVFLDWLVDRGFVFRDGDDNYRAYSKYLDDGLFVYKYINKSKYRDFQLLITSKGRKHFKNKIMEELGINENNIL